MTTNINGNQQAAMYQSRTASIAKGAAIGIGIAHIILGSVSLGVAAYARHTNVHSCQIGVGIWGGAYFLVLGILLIFAAFWQTNKYWLRFVAVFGMASIPISLVLFFLPIFDHCQDFPPAIVMVYMITLCVMGMLEICTSGVTTCLLSTVFCRQALCFGRRTYRQQPPGMIPLQTVEYRVGAETAGSNQDSGKQSTYIPFAQVPQQQPVPSYPYPGPQHAPPPYNNKLYPNPHPDYS